MGMVGERPRDGGGQYVGTLDEEQVVDAVHEAGHVATTAEVADALDTSQDTARRWLKRLHDDGAIERKKVGARGVVWWIDGEP